MTVNRRGVVVIAVMFIVGFVALVGYVVGSKHPGILDSTKTEAR